MIYKKILLFNLITLLLVNISACSFENDEKKDVKENEYEYEVPEQIEEIELTTLNIIKQIDMLSLIEEPGIEAQAGVNNENNNENNNEEASENEEEEDDNDKDDEDEDEDEKEQITFEETILTEVIQKELENNNNEGDNNEEHPENSEEIWDEVKLLVKELHDMWNELRPKLKEEDIPAKKLTKFETTLDSLTLSCTKENYYEALTSANEITLHLAIFHEPLTEDPIPGLFQSKYNIRNIIIKNSQNDFANTRQSLNKLKELHDTTVKELKAIDENEVAEKYTSDSSPKTGDIT